MPLPLLTVDDLTIEIDTPRGPARPVDRVSLSVAPGGALALVGESGSGKSLTALAILGLLPKKARVIAGRIAFDGRDLSGLDAVERRALLGASIGAVFQDPAAALNPVLTIGEQIAEVLRAHRRATRAEARSETLKMLERVKLADPERCARAYPHELSGGMRQRALIAAALIASPALLVADEPTAHLDRAIALEILDLIGGLLRSASRPQALLLISHDLELVRTRAQEIAIMYAGRVVERGPSARVFEAPAHPYTRALLTSLEPEPGGAPGTRAARFRTIDGAVPDPGQLPAGCRFGPRCSLFEPACASAEPEAVAVATEHSASCRKAGA